MLQIQCTCQSSLHRRQHTVHSLIAVWQVEVHNGIKDKAQLSALALLRISLGWQKLVNVGISDAVHFLHAIPHCCWCAATQCSRFQMHFDKSWRKCGWLVDVNLSRRIEKIGFATMRTSLAARITTDKI